MDTNTKQLPVIYNSQVFCVLPWVHLCASVDGVWGRCCLDATMYYDHYYKAKIEPEFKLQKEAIGCLPLSRYSAANPQKTFNLLEAFNSPAMKKTRNAMLVGERVGACQYCYDKENRGGISYRQIANEMFKEQVDLAKLLENTSADGLLDEFPCYLDIRFGNTCNLECIMCNFPISSKWGKKMHPPWLTANINPYESDEELWTILKENAFKIRRIYFAGGEPLLQPLHFKLLDLLIAAGCASSINVGYSTNLTVLPKGIFDKLREFRSVDIGASCDGVGEVFEFIRVGAKWSDFVRNVRETKKHFQVRLAVVPQKANIASLDQLIEWAISEECEIDLSNILLYPEELSISRLSNKEKTVLAEKYRALSQAYYQKGYERIAADLRGILRFLHSGTARLETADTEEIGRKDANTI